jgi:FixJ family two-component response regulator
MRRSRFLRSAGYTAQSFSSAEQFLESPQLEQTDCLVTDVQMPGLSGVELQDRLLSDGHDVPTIFISAFPNPRLEQKVLKSGAIAYLRKPFKEEQLLEHIGAAVKRSDD